jgi:hypothetical protein
VPTDVLTADDVARSDDLRRMKIAATGLFVAVDGRVRRLADPVGRRRRARLRARVRGGGDGRALADWFAVTALFRHPLGLPIPHTAIIPHRKDQIGASLGQFVETNFLTRELLEERLERARVGARLGEWLADPGHAERASAAMADALRGAVDVLDDEAISGTVGTMVETRLREFTCHRSSGARSTSASTAAPPAAPRQRPQGALRLPRGEQGHVSGRVCRRSRRGGCRRQIDDRIFAKIFKGVQSSSSTCARTPITPVRDSIHPPPRDLRDPLRGRPRADGEG